MSSASNRPTVQPMHESSAQITASNNERNRPVSSPGELPIGGDIANPTTTQQRWNGDPMDWESWPIGRPGPFGPATSEAMDSFHSLDSKRSEWSRTEEKVFHIAEFSSINRDIFLGHITEPELATRLEKPHDRGCVRLLFASSQRNRLAIDSTYARRILSACGAPAAVRTTLVQCSTSPCHSFIDILGGNLVFHGWMALRLQWKPFKGGLDLLSEPYLSYLKDRISHGNTTLYPKLYFSYNTGTRQTTIMTTDLSRVHLRMVQYLETLPEMASQPASPEQVVRLLLQYLAVVRESFGEIATDWDDRAAGEETVSQTLGMSDDHNGDVQSAESFARIVDRTRSDFMAFQAALTSLGRHLQDNWSILNHYAAFTEALFIEQKELCEATRYLLDGLVSRYDRHLTLLLNYTNIRIIEGVKNVSEENAKMTAGMKELAEKNADMMVIIADLMRQNAEATKRMAELAEVSRLQAVQGARQAEAMDILAYNAKHNSEVMEACRN